MKKNYDTTAPYIERYINRAKHVGATVTQYYGEAYANLLMCIVFTEFFAAVREYEATERAWEDAEDAYGDP